MSTNSKFDSLTDDQRKAISSLIIDGLSKEEAYTVVMHGDASGTKQEAHQDSPEQGMVIPEDGWQHVQQIGIPTKVMDQIVCMYLGMRAQMDGQSRFIKEEYIHTSKGNGFKIMFYGGNIQIFKCKRGE